MTIVFIWII